MDNSDHRRGGSSRVQGAESAGGDFEVVVKTDAATPEAALVLALAAGDAPASQRALGERPDPDRTAELAGRHQVDALCWWMWRHVVTAQDGAVDLPPALHKRLRGA